MAGKFEVKATKNGQFMFNLKASNGEIILTSEMYKTKNGAEERHQVGQDQCQGRRALQDASWRRTRNPILCCAPATTR